MPVANFTAPNGDSEWADFSGLFTKALEQSSEGVVRDAVGKAFIDAINAGKAAVTANPAVRPVGPPPGTALFEDSALRLGGAAKLNGPQGAFAGQILPPESPSYSIPPPKPPKVGSRAYAVELAELYWASLLRDVPFAGYVASNPLVKAACDDLTHWLADYYGPTDNNRVTPELLFRGGLRDAAAAPGSPSKFFADERFGPYLSQLCLSPTSLGAQPLDQMIETFAAGRDFMTDLDSWYAVQNGKPPSAVLERDGARRLIRCGRDLAAYTHADELYQAYFIAYLVLSTWQAPPNRGIPYTTYKNQKAFGSMGGPDIAATLALVARGALDAVWWQKWVVHLRHRPEAGGGLVHLAKIGSPNPPMAIASFDPQFLAILNTSLQASALRYSRRSATTDAEKTWLLSQAFPEGSPTHPAFPTGHGTVAGACITVLKFFFDGDQRISALTQPVTPSVDGLSLHPYDGADVGDMTVNGELHKLAHNISFGHGIHAGIHWRSDTDQSLLLGEQVAINYLTNLMTKYSEPARISITLMDGGSKMFANY